MALRRPCFPAALPHGFSVCGVLRPFRRIFLPWGFFVRASAFSARCVAFCRCGLMLLFLPSDISAEIMAAFFGGRLLPLQRAVFGTFQKAVFWLAKGGLLQPEKIPFAR